MTDNQQLLSDLAAYLQEVVRCWLFRCVIFLQVLEDFQSSIGEELSTVCADELEEAKEEIERLSRNDDPLEAIASRLNHLGAPVRILVGPDLEYIHEQFAKLEF